MLGFSPLIQIKRKRRGELGKNDDDREEEIERSAFYIQYIHLYNTLLHIAQTTLLRQFELHVYIYKELMCCLIEDVRSMRRFLALERKRKRQRETHHIFRV